MEVMVALVVLATAMGALIKGSSQSAASTAYIRNKTFASWVAQNRIAEMQLQKFWPSVGRSEGESKMAGESWYWQVETIATAEEAMRQLQVKVSLNPDYGKPIITMSAFISRP